MTYGVIGNTLAFGASIQGSSPCKSTKYTPIEITGLKSLYFQHQI
jgi:hypothetical protein